MKTKRTTRKAWIGIAIALLIFNMLIAYFSSLFAQVTITKPMLDFGFCNLPSNYFLLSDIVIQETTKSDFVAGTNKTIVITSPAGFEFQPAVGSVSAANGGNLSSVTMIVSANQLTVQYTCNAVSKFDVLTITGIQIRAVNSASSGTLIRTGGTAVIGGLSINTSVSNQLLSTQISGGTYRTKSNTLGLLDWNQPTTWECGVVPPNDGSAHVIIRGYSGVFSSGNCVFFSGSPDVQSIILETGANFSPPQGTNNNLKIRGDFTIQSGAFLRQRNWVQNGQNSIQIGGGFSNNGEMITDGSNNAYDLTIEMNGIVPQIISGSGIFQLLGNGNGKSSLVITNLSGVTMHANFSTQSSFGDPGEILVNGYVLFSSELVQFTGLGSLVLNGKTTLSAPAFNLHFAQTGLKTISNSSTIEFTHPNSVISPTNIPSLFLNNLQVSLGSNGNINVQTNLIVNGTLSMNSGLILTGSNTIQLGSSNTSLGSLNYQSGFVVGKMKRWFFGSNNGQSSGLFPMADPTGKWKRFVLIEYSEPTLGGTLTTEWKETPMGTNFTNSMVQTSCDGQFSISKTASGYWSVFPADGLTESESVKYQITMAADGILDFSNDCHITAVKKSGTLPWDQVGIHLDNTGNAVAPVLKRVDAIGWSNWGFAGEDTPLPIELNEFSCTKIGNEAHVSWTTSSEFNSDHFELLKSETGANWNIVSTILAAGTSNELLSYLVRDFFVDNQVYYLLKQVDRDGAESFFGPIELTSSSDEDIQVNISSNPSDENFTVHIQNPGLPLVSLFNVWDFKGNKVLETNLLIHPGENTYDISLSAISSGIYFIQLSSNRSFRKYIKQYIQVK